MAAHAAHCRAFLRNAFIARPVRSATTAAGAHLGRLAALQTPRHTQCSSRGVRACQVQAPAATSQSASTPIATEAAPRQDSTQCDGPERQKPSKPQPLKKEIVATVDMLDIRVGQIVSVSRHPDADALYVEEIDVGEEQPRQIVSGLVKFVPEEQMAGRKVLVLANLKPAKLRGIVSSGMVLCASNEAHDKVEPVLVPEGVPVGEKVTFEGFDGAPEAVLNPKKKLWEKIAPDLRINPEGIAVYKDIPFMTSSGAITSSLQDARVS